MKSTTTLGRRRKRKRRNTPGQRKQGCTQQKSNLREWDTKLATACLQVSQVPTYKLMRGQEFTSQKTIYELKETSKVLSHIIRLDRSSQSSMLKSNHLLSLWIRTNSSCERLWREDSTGSNKNSWLRSTSRS